MKADNHQIPELVYLLRRVEEKYGRSINTSTDFEALSVTIEREIGEFVSSSTLKRLWGYVSLHPAPRVATLDVLCRYLGYASFADFRKKLREDPAFESGFFTTRFVSCDELPEGVKVTIGWAPDRLVTLTCLGDCRFRVVGNEHSKLMVGDEFTVSQFMMGYPMFVDRILRGGEWTPSYVAGKKEGLNYLSIE